MCIAYDNLVAQSEQALSKLALCETKLAERNSLLAEKDSLLAERDLKLKLFEQLLKESGCTEEEIRAYLSES